MFGAEDYYGETPPKIKLLTNAQLALYIAQQRYETEEDIFKYAEECLNWLKRNGEKCD